MSADANTPLSYPTLSPYLLVDPAPEAIEWYTTVFEATVRMVLEMPDGAVGHAELAIGDGVLMLADSSIAPADLPVDGRSHVTVWVPNCDATFSAAVAAGATPQREPADQFYGDRTAAFTDPFGHRWTVQHNIEPLSPAEVAARMANMTG